MAFIPVPNVVSVEIRAALAGQQIENILYFLHDAGQPTPADILGLLTALQPWVELNLGANLSNEYAYRELYATDLTTAVSPTVAVPLSETGGQLAPSLPNNVCFCVSFRTETRGRSGRGRNYISGLIDLDVTGNTLSVSRADSIVSSFENLLNVTVPAGWTWVIVSRYANGAPRIAGLPIPVTSVTYADRFIDSQRRRLTGRGS